MVPLTKNTPDKKHPGQKSPRTKSTPDKKGWRVVPRTIDYPDSGRRIAVNNPVGRETPKWTKDAQPEQSTPASKTPVANH